MIKVFKEPELKELIETSATETELQDMMLELKCWKVYDFHLENKRDCYELWINSYALI